MRILTSVKSHIAHFNKKLYLHSLRSRNSNYDFTLITNNCVGGIIYHNLGLQFKSPTINLYIKGEEFLSFVTHLKYYLQCELKEEAVEGLAYPVGVLLPDDDSHIPVHVYFQHYKSFAEASAKWIERCKRVNWENIFFLWEYYDDVYGTELIKEFDKLPIKKCCLLHHDIEGVSNKMVIVCGSGEPWRNGLIFCNDGISGKMYLDQFDYVSFLNKGVNPIQDGNS